MVEAFIGNPFGSVQSTFVDQMATALPGDIFASDDNLIDPMMVNEANGINLGSGVQSSYNASPLRAGIGNRIINLPTANTLAYNFAGIVVRQQSAWERSTGLSGYIPYQRPAAVLRPERSGGRAWVPVLDTISAGDPVYWVRANAVSGNVRPIGSFTNQTITGAGAGDSVLLPQCIWRSLAVSGQNAQIEMLGGIAAATAAGSSQASSASSSLASSNNSSSSSNLSSSSSLLSSSYESVALSSYSSAASSVGPAASSLNSSAQSSVSSY